MRKFDELSLDNAKSIEIDASLLRLWWSACQVHQVLLDYRPDSGARGEVIS